MPASIKFYEAGVHNAPLGDTESIMMLNVHVQRLHLPATAYDYLCVGLPILCLASRAEAV